MSEAEDEWQRGAEDELEMTTTSGSSSESSSDGGCDDRHDDVDDVAYDCDAGEDEYAAAHDECDDVSRDANDTADGVGDVANGGCGVVEGEMHMAKSSACGSGDD